MNSSLPFREENCLTYTSPVIDMCIPPNTRAAESTQASNCGIPQKDSTLCFTYLHRSPIPCSHRFLFFVSSHSLAPVIRVIRLVESDSAQTRHAPPHMRIVNLVVSDQANAALPQRPASSVSPSLWSKALALPVLESVTSKFATGRGATRVFSRSADGSCIVCKLRMCM